MKKIIFALLLIGAYHVHSQGVPDSIEHQLAKMNGDALRVQHLLDLANQYFRSNPELSRDLLDRSLLIADSSNRRVDYGKILVQYGIIHLYQGRIEWADSLYKQAQKLFIGEQDTVGIIRTFKELGTLHYKIGNDSAAISNGYAAYKLAEKINEDLLLAFISNNLSSAYRNLGDYENSVYFLRKAIKVKEKLSDKSVGSSYHNLGITLKSMGLIDSAKYYFQKSIKSKKKYQDKRGLANSYNSMTYFFIDPFNADSLFYYHYKCIALDEELGDTISLSFDWHSLADTYRQIKNWDKAIEYAIKSLAIAKDGEVIELNYQYLAEAYQAKGEFERSNQMLSKYVFIHDSLRRIEKENSIAEMKVKFDTERKEKENQILKGENRINELELSQARTQMYLILMLTLVLTIGLIFAIVQHRLRKKLLVAEIDELRAKINSNLIQKGVALNVTLESFNKKNHNDLTEREYEILKLAITQKSNSQIAEEVFVSVNTVKFHLKNIFNKLGVANRVEALELVTQKHS
ncbi:tetratricopeptide repeat protein [Reichenbachiella carrageenanivorans]|uniref:Tetratricopeptide repeat protein n=1 Tax=Reichenbachiella carrageenanivorans TaxID=2979869 RepID=A0ABY6D3U3_9BACT|nr:tetratricopeptide repeat protein [Reichenbachiella carrageenanivorans]UXX80834.1 tetratricopeptide repeat protein [Reichenbachiella carrageenanivorans]